MAVNGEVRGLKDHVVLQHLPHLFVLGPVFQIWEKGWGGWSAIMFIVASLPGITDSETEQRPLGSTPRRNRKNEEIHIEEMSNTCLCRTLSSAVTILSITIIWSLLEPALISVLWCPFGCIPQIWLYDKMKTSDVDTWNLLYQRITRQELLLPLNRQGFKKSHKISFVFCTFH